MCVCVSHFSVLRRSHRKPFLFTVRAAPASAIIILSATCGARWSLSSCTICSERSVLSIPQNSNTEITSLPVCSTSRIMCTQCCFTEDRTDSIENFKPFHCISIKTNETQAQNINITHNTHIFKYINFSINPIMFNKTPKCSCHHIKSSN